MQEIGKYVFQEQVSFAINVFGNSSVHMTSIGRHVARANKPFEVRALITSEEDDFLSVPSLAWLTATLKLVGVDHFGTIPVDMFNIGMPPSVYGGSATVPTPGLYRLVAEGTLEDGSKFIRVDPTPIRVRAHDMTGSGDAPSLPGSTRLVSFELVNDGVAGVAGLSSATTFDLELFSELGWTTSDAIPEFGDIGARGISSIHCECHRPRQCRYRFGRRQHARCGPPRRFGWDCI